MRPDPFPNPGDGGQEPDTEPAQQGLFLCVPAGSLDTDRFTQSGPAADMPPDPLLATIIDTVLGEDGKGLAGLSDDQLTGIIAAIRRLESRAAWYLMTAVAEFTARNSDEPCAAEFAADQLACELHLTNASAGQSGVPADVAGFGLVHPADARDLMAAAARDPRTRWCVTALHPDGTAAAHGCAAGRHPPPAPGPGPPHARDWIGRLRIQLTPIARGTCDHDHAEPGYRPSRKLQHLVKIRNARCAAPGCGRPAARCDLDHTIAWDQGGLTCECDLAPPCQR